jgi:hypothetical protein
MARLPTIELKADWRVISQTRTLLTFSYLFPDVTWDDHKAGILRCDCDDSNVAAAVDIPCDEGDDDDDEGDDLEVEVHYYSCSDFSRDSVEVVVAVMDVLSRMNVPEELASWGTCAEGEVAGSYDRMDAEVEFVAAAAVFHWKWKKQMLLEEDPTKKLVLGLSLTAQKNHGLTFSVRNC